MLWLQPIKGTSDNECPFCYIDYLHNASLFMWIISIIPLTAMAKNNAGGCTNYVMLIHLSTLCYSLTAFVIHLAGKSLSTKCSYLSIAVAVQNTALSCIWNLRTRKGKTKRVVLLLKVLCQLWQWNYITLYNGMCPMCNTDAYAISEPRMLRWRVVLYFS